MKDVELQKLSLGINMQTSNIIESLFVVSKFKCVIWTILVPVEIFHSMAFCTNLKTYFVSRINPNAMRTSYNQVVLCACVM